MVLPYINCRFCYDSERRTLAVYTSHWYSLPTARQMRDDEWAGSGGRQSTLIRLAGVIQEDT